MVTRNIVVIGASAGGVEALQKVVKALPKNFPATVFVVLHISQDVDSALASILSCASHLPVEDAAHQERFHQGHIYVGVRDLHLLLEDNRMLLVRGPKENRCRPAVDALFRSAALAYGPRVIGVLLSGSLDDGTIGLWQVKQRGGLAVVQDPKDARFSGMVQSALDNVQVDYIVPALKMGALLTRLVKSRAPEAEKYPVTSSMKTEHRIAKMQDTVEDVQRLGPASRYTCPECHGTLFELRDGQLVKYRCRTGHAYSPGTLRAEQRKSAEELLWAAMRALREEADMFRQSAESNSKDNKKKAALEKERAEALKFADGIRHIIEKHGRGPSE